MSGSKPRSRKIVWIGASKADISGLPAPLKASFGHRLQQVQEDKTPLEARRLPTFGTGVWELRERFDTNTFRVVYAVSLRKAVYVLHAFMKKSKTGISLPRPDADLIEARLKRTRTLDAED